MNYHEDDDNEGDEREVEIISWWGWNNEENDDSEDDEHDIDHELHDDDIDWCNFIYKSYSNTFQENLCHEYTKVVLVTVLHDVYIIYNHSISQYICYCDVLSFWDA